MKTIQIKATPFFEMLKTNDTSMWEIFAQLMDGEEKELIFTDDQDQILFSYTLPDSLEKLNEDREKFAQEYAEKLSGMN